MNTLTPTEQEPQSATTETSSPDGDGIVRPSLKGFLKSFSSMVAYAYVLWFGTVSLPARRIVTTSFSFLAILAAGHFLGETLLILIKSGSHEIHIPAILLLLIPGVYMLYHRIEELVAIQRRPELLQQVNSRIHDLATLRFATPGKEDDELTAFVIDLLQGFYRVFKDIRGVYLNVMLPNEEGLLVICYQVPLDSRYPRDLKLRPDQGAAGVAYQYKNIVYVPHVRFLHGVMRSVPPIGRQAERVVFNLSHSVYVPKQPHPPFKSVLSLPLVGASKVFGVLNLDVEKRNRFSESDIQMAEVAAGFLGAALERYHAAKERNSQEPAR
jgi:hypothetical protein